MISRYGIDDTPPEHMTYTATYDRFDRLGVQVWTYWEDGYSDTGNYSYDRDSNVIGRTRATGTPYDGATYLLFSSYTPYDNLNRLTSYSWSLGGDGWEDNPTGSESWDLDASGNWNDVTPDGAATEYRDNNAQNQIAARDGNTMTYDGNGNLTYDQEADVSYVYDAWNRLASVTLMEDDVPISTTAYGYDALGRQITEGNPSTPTHLYYSANEGQVIEEQDDSGVTKAQYVWSAAQPGVLVLRDSDTGSGGSYGKSSSGLDQRLWAEVDAQGSVVALIPDVGNVAEHFQYDPYGNVTVYDGTWNLLGSDAFNFKVMYQGQRLDATTGLYDFHARVYSPTLGRFLQQDPMGYVDGANLYQMEMSNPSTFVDPMGTDHVYPPSWGSVPIAIPDDPAPRQPTSSALLGALSPQQANCPKCQQEAKELGDAIDKAVDGQPWQFSGQIGNGISGITGAIMNPLHPISGAQEGGWGNQCGNWQALIDNAIQSILNRYGRNTCFSVNNANASGMISTHNWVEISGGGGTVVIDPWPSGGSNIVDPSSSGGWPDSMVKRPQLNPFITPKGGIVPSGCGCGSGSGGGAGGGSGSGPGGKPPQRPTPTTQPSPRLGNSVIQ